MNLTTNLKYLFKLIETFLRKVLYFYLVLRLSLVFRVMHGFNYVQLFILLVVGW